MLFIDTQNMDFKGTILSASCKIANIFYLKVDLFDFKDLPHDTEALRAQSSFYFPSKVMFSQESSYNN